MSEAGKLRDRVTLSVREMVNPDSPFDFGNTVGEWAYQATVWAAIHYLRGSEDVIAGRLQGRQPVVVRVRSSEITREVAPDWQLTDERTGIEYAVRSVNSDPEGDRAWIDLLCESGVAA